MPATIISLVLLIGAIASTIDAAYSNKNTRFFKIAAFNIQIFGPTKSSKVDVMEIITQIVQRYDIILIQEIRDKSGKTPEKLLKAINTNGYSYSMKLSDRLGRTYSKENYAFYYRNDTGITIVDSFHYDDGSEEKGVDTFEREPFVVKFSIPSLSVREIGIIGLHVDPDTVVRELTALADVFKAVENKFKIDTVIAMGDFNAGCRYLSEKQEKSLSLKSDKYFWPIEYGTDTTLAATDCSYDRFIIGGAKLIELAKSGDSSVFKFDSEYELTKEKSMSVSDHYPIELFLPTKTVVPLSTTATITTESSGINPVNYKLSYSILYGAVLFIILLKMLN
ncbi:deoxyribonuclease-1 isoform X1 [Octopus sinensis]|uniref:Deoxyribonuclease-1 isoform X1 n=1 Tax=Octopus sinensis TaxID=2607531 RepID=A0A6P7TZH8_9MOLL|nr:deoxyribonuclease-1 isoform X1 [Octopus sinensis]